MRKAELINVSNANNNKYYKMFETADGYFTAEWGRVGYTPQTQTYPKSQWDKKYREKIRHGYKDISELKTSIKTTSFKDVSDANVQTILSDLQAFSKKTVVDNYTVGTDAVTLAQVNKAQEIIDELAIIKSSKKIIDNSLIDNKLIDIYTTIPRKMANVKNQLYSNNTDSKWLNNKISEEQSLIDVMRQQVELCAVDDKDSKTLTDALGIDMKFVNDGQTIDFINKLLGEDSRNFSKAYAVLNFKTEEKFKEVKNKNYSPKTSVLWHGSRNENWLNIIKTGLLIRPSGVVTTGSMFGNGIYFADKAKKSIGYTSMSGSYWARGNANVFYLALYEVNVGNQYEVVSGQYDMNLKKLRAYGSYDSLFAKAGHSLYNNEFIIYQPEQATIKFLVELKNK